MIESLEQIYRFRDHQKVRSYLERNPDLVDAVAEAAATIPQFLPSLRKIELDVIVDPEDDAAEGELFALISTDLGPDEVRPLLARMRREWLVGLVQRMGGRFNVGVVYA